MINKPLSLYEVNKTIEKVLKEGKVLLCQHEDLLYEIAFRTAQAFEDFKHIYYGYLEEVAGARP